jgi:tetratricopeptide (TPR) repeat protein
MKCDVSLFARIITIALLLVFGIEAKANEADLAIFEAANQHYENGQYEEAKEKYIQLLESEYLSDDLHYNLGNTYFKLKGIAPAILHYEKALKINPANADAAFNLKLANQKTVDKIESIPDLFIYRWWNSIYNLFPASRWAAITIALFFIAVFAVFLFLFTSYPFLKRVGFYGGLIAFIIGLFSWFLAFQQTTNLETKKHAIVMNASVNIISAPSEGSSQLFVLHEGTKVSLRDQTGNWLKVSLPNGNEGWIEAGQLAVI